MYVELNGCIKIGACVSCFFLSASCIRICEISHIYKEQSLVTDEITPRRLQSKTQKTTRAEPKLQWNLGQS